MKMTAKILEQNKKTYRYELTRIFDESKPIIILIGLNPSTANDKENDPTILKCISYAKNWNCGGFIMVNLFAFQATKPKDLLKEENPIGADNDKYIKAAILKREKIVCCWGKLGTYKGRGAEVLKLIDKPYCLYKLKNGQPAHPLYKNPKLELKLYNETDRN